MVHLVACHDEPWFLETPTERCLDESFVLGGKITFRPHNSPEAKWTMHHVRNRSSVLHSGSQKTFHLCWMRLCLCVSKWTSFLRMQMCMNQKNHVMYIHENSVLELMTSNLRPHYSSDAANACIKERFLNKWIHKTLIWPLSLRHHFCIYPKKWR